MLMLAHWFTVLTCPECSTTYALPNDFVRQRQEDHRGFYCPNGCCRYYPQNSEEEILKERLRCCKNKVDEQELEIRTVSLSNRALKGHITRAKTSQLSEAPYER